MAKWFGGSKEPDEDGKRVLIEQLRGRFSDEALSEATFRRFLMAKSWNMDEAAVLLQAHVKWRAENLPVALEEVQPVLDSGTLMYLGNGAGGHPILVLGFKHLNQVDWKAEGAMRQHLRAVAYCAELAIAGMPDGVETWVYIVDCTGIRAPPAGFMSEFTKLMQANYPERDHKIILYPIPWFISSFVKSFMVMLPERARGKVSFLSTPSDLCEETGLPMAKLPEHMQGAVDVAALNEGSLLEIKAGGTVTHRHALAAGESVKWSFKVAEHNVSFELRFAVSEGDSSPKGYTVKKVDKIGEGEGDFTAEHAGALEFVFDNSFSYMRGKSVFVSCEPLDLQRASAQEQSPA